MASCSNTDVARELVRLGVDRFVVSVDGVRPDTYANIRGSHLYNKFSTISAF